MKRHRNKIEIVINDTIWTIKLESLINCDPNLDSCNMPRRHQKYHQTTSNLYAPREANSHHSSAQTSKPTADQKGKEGRTQQGQRRQSQDYGTCGEETEKDAKNQQEIMPIQSEAPSLIIRQDFQAECWGD